MNVLISSAGRRVALLRIFREALSALGVSGRVLAADMTRVSSAMVDADAGFVVPRCTDPSFVPTVLDICRRENVRLIVPTIDPELPVYAAHKQQFADAGVTIAISSPEVIAIGGDKVATHRWLKESGLPTVEQIDAAELRSGTTRWPYPFIVKPRFGSASIGVSVVRSDDELMHHTRGGEYLAQTLAPGKEYTVDVWVDAKGRCRAAVPRKRLEVRAGEVSKGMIVRHPTLERLAQQVCEKLPGAYGVLNFQVFFDEATGQLAIIEINARFGGGYPLTWQGGGRYAQWLLEELLELPSTAPESPDAAACLDGLVMLRFDDAVFASRSELGL